MHHIRFEQTFSLFSPDPARLNSVVSKQTRPSTELQPDLHFTQAFMESALKQLNSLAQLSAPLHQTHTLYPRGAQPERIAYLNALKPLFLAAAAQLEALLFLSPTSTVIQPLSTASLTS